MREAARTPFLSCRGQESPPPPARAGEPGRAPSRLRQIWPLVGLILLAVVVRGGWIGLQIDDLSLDEDNYAHVAEVFVQTGTFAHGRGEKDYTRLAPTAHRPPLYPLMIAFFAGEGSRISVERIAVLNFLLAIGTIGLVYLFGREAVPEKPWFAHLAAFLTIFDPLLLDRSAHVMTEGPAAFLAAGFAYAAVRTCKSGRWWGWIFPGVVLGLAALCRPTFLPVLPLVAGVVFLLELRRQSWQTGLMAAVAVVLGGAVALGPWTWRNQQVFGKPLLTTTHGGHTLALANSPDYFEQVQKSGFSSPWEFDAFTHRVSQLPPLLATVRPDGPGYQSRDPLKELEMDRMLNEMAWNWIGEHPRDFLYLAFGRLAQFWKPMPGPLGDHSGWMEALVRYGTGGWYLGLYALMLLGLPLAWRQGWLPVHLAWWLPLVFVFSGVHFFYWVNMRMRTPLSPFLCVLAATGLLALVQAGWQAWARRRSAV